MGVGGLFNKSHAFIATPQGLQGLAWLLDVEFDNNERCLRHTYIHVVVEGLAQLGHTTQHHHLRHLHSGVLVSRGGHSSHADPIPSIRFIACLKV